MNDFAPIVICGVGRSGTSLLQSMLAAHPLVCIPPETHFFRTYVAPSRRRRSIEEAGAMKLVRMLESDSFFTRAGVSARDLLAPWMDTTSRLDLAAVYRRLLEVYAAGESCADGVRLGDKDPKNIEFLAAMDAAFPAAQVIHMTRDPRAVLASRMKAKWSAHRPWWSHPLVQSLQWRRGQATGAAQLGARWLNVRYESLVEDPEPVLRTVCEHVGISYDSGMLEFGAAAKRLVHSSEVEWKSNTFGPLDPANAEKWRQQLTPGQIAWCETVCARQMRRDGYPSTSSAARRALLAPLAWVMTAAAGLSYAIALWRRA